MTRETIAAIDIGSNAIRLLVNYVESNGSVGFKKAAFLRVPLRLGEDVFTAGSIGEEKQARLCLAMEAFAKVMEVFNVKKYRACATSAMREATNGAQVAERIRSASGIEVEIISGREEAEIIFEAGGITGLMDSDKSYLYVDVGGGSIEVTVYSNHSRVSSESFPLGTVRTISGATDTGEMERFRQWLKEIASRYSPSAIIGSGGNIAKAHKLLLKKEGESIQYVELKVLYEQLGDMSYEERMAKRGLNQYRADVIMPALEIYLMVGKICKINDIIVPKTGLADGIIRRLARS